MGNLRFEDFQIYLSASREVLNLILHEFLRAFHERLVEGLI